MSETTAERKQKPQTFSEEPTEVTSSHPGLISSSVSFSALYHMSDVG